MLTPPELRIVEIAERLKGVERLNRTLNGRRFENSAEHSWHAALTALALQSWSNEPINVFESVAMLIVHDMVEVFAGDTNPFDQIEASQQIDKELDASRRLYQEMGEEHLPFTLLENFREGKSPEARFAQAVDKFMPAFLSMIGEGNLNEKVKFSKAAYLREKSTIAHGSRRLWGLMQSIIEEMETRQVFQECDEQRGGV